MDNKTAFEMVGEFHRVFGHPFNDKAAPQSDKTARLRIKLILEETAELIEATAGGDPKRAPFLMGIAGQVRYAIELIQSAPEGEFETQDLVGIADALTDLVYVVNGAGHAWGINLDKCMDEVHRSNMSKLGEDGLPIYREDGKVMKGPNYTPPNLEPIVFPPQEVDEAA